MKNLITDIEGILVGCAEDHKFSTGVTVLSGPSPFTAAVDVRGGGAGTRGLAACTPAAETDPGQRQLHPVADHQAGGARSAADPNQAGSLRSGLTFSIL